MNRSPGETPRVIGRAKTTGGPNSIEGVDPIEPARAVRRALADAGRKAFEVDAFVLGIATLISDRALRSFARRALGPHGDDVALRQHLPAAVSAETVSAETLAAETLATLNDESTHRQLSVVVGLATDGTTVALCVETPRRSSRG